jgi:TIR domain
MRMTVFLSYTRADRETVDVLEDLLQRHGIGCWIDRRGIRLGERFDLEIERAVRRSGAVVWVVSSESVQNQYVKYEVTTALNHRRPVFPVRLEPIDLLRLPAPLNLKLGSVQAWDYFAAPPEDLGAGIRSTNDIVLILL